MEKMFEMMVKSMGFDPSTVKSHVEKAAKLFNDMYKRNCRIEQKLDLLLKEKGIEFKELDNV